jgi:hypothetical protein
MKKTQTQFRLTLSPPGEVGLNNGNYKRIFLGLDSWLDQDVSTEAIGEINFRTEIERDTYIATLKLQDWS